MAKGLTLLFLLLLSVPVFGSDPTSRIEQEIVRQQQETSRTSRAAAIEQKRLRECNAELTTLAEKIRAESRAKGNPEGTVTFGTGPKDVDFYLGLRFMELQRRCTEMKNEIEGANKALKATKDIPAVILD
jgi:hypothetical protein